MLEILRAIRFLAGYLSLSYLAIGIWLWEAETKTHLPAETKWSLYAGAIVAISFANWRSAIRKAEAAEEALGAGRQRAPERRVFAEDPEILLDHYGAAATMNRVEPCRVEARSLA